MQNQQSIGIDLPQKFLVWEDRDGQVHVTYNDPLFIGKRHGLQGLNVMLGKIGNRLGALANDINILVEEESFVPGLPKKEVTFGRTLKFETCTKYPQKQHDNYPQKGYKNIECPTLSPAKKLVAVDHFTTTVKLLERKVGSVECCFEMSINIPGVPPYKACFIDPNRDHCIIGSPR